MSLLETLMNRYVHRPCPHDIRLTTYSLGLSSDTSEESTSSQPALKSDASSSASNSSPSPSTPDNASSKPSPFTGPSPPSQHLKLRKTTTCAVIQGKAPVQINISIINVASRDVVRYAGVHFHNELTDYQGLKRRTHDARISCVDDAITQTKKDYLCFEYTNRVLFGTDNIPDDWPQEIKVEMKELASYPRSGLMKVRMPNDPASGAATVSALLELLNGVSPNKFLPSLSYVPEGQRTRKYIETWDELTWAYGKGRKINYDGRTAAAEAVHCFGSPLEAQLRLTHGRYADHLWEKKRSYDISNFVFHAAFAKTRNDTCLAFVRTTEKGDLPRISDRVALEISFNAWGYSKADNVKLMKCFKAMGHLTLNEFGFEFDVKAGAQQTTNSMVLLLRRVPERMLEKAVKISSVESDGSGLQFMSVDLKVKDYQQALLQVEAINTFFKSQEALYRNFWAGFMGVNSSDLKLQNFLTEKHGFTKQYIDSVVATIRRKLAAAGLDLNPEQDKILSTLGDAYGGWRLIRGPPGTGKSTLIAVLACTLLSFSGLGILLVAPSNGAASKLFGSLVAVLDILQISDPACKPLRLFRKYYELDHFFAYFDPEGSAEEGNLTRLTDDEAVEILEDNMDDWYSRQLASEDRRLVDDPKHGVMAAVIQAFEDNNLFETAGVHGTVEGAGTKLARQTNHYRTAKKALAELKLHKDHRCDLEKNCRWKLKKLAFAVADQIIGTRRVIICTADSTTSLMAKESIFRDCKAWSCMFDEQTLATEASTLSVAAGTVRWQRVSDEFGGVTPLDSMLLVGDEQQGTPLVQSHQDEKNLFGPQMELSTFERLVKVGFPVDTLLEQHRMVPFFRELPSKRCYDGLLRDSLEVRSRRLSDRERQSLRRLLRKPTLDTEATAETENRHLRHLLLDVPGTTEEKEQQTASRLNKSNVAVTIDLVKYLVLQGLVTPREIVVLTFYNAQKKEYIRALSNLEKPLGLKIGEFDDCVETCDSFQGRERKCVILDFVVTEYLKNAKMGNVSNERKMNVGCTRARDFFFVVAKADILNSENIPYGRLEYGLELLQRLKDRDALVAIKVLKGLASEALERKQLDSKK